ncbi:MAG: helix-turn-helix domain-containing protein [Anaeromicrobium sp.]|jgi:IS30 family transposase|uniref:DUF6115 domain-containing protein n=1 Tax=Anaeromicrobium sp. TaxID=1929132 RepID=UPI0025D2EF44|nr:hypothetical protein [Anaeromicrobium sp.]MCT4595611.1 helix-turn-helix domain-containing protein [Anaeromicrobium sp.]
MLNYIILVIGVLFVIVGTLSFFKDGREEEVSEDFSLENIEHEINRDKDEEIIRKVDGKLEYIEECIELIDMKVDSLNIKGKNEKEKEVKVQKKNINYESTNIDHRIINQDNINEEILKLYKDGYSISQIAKRLNRGIGEVQLICNLKKR